MNRLYMNGLYGISFYYPDNFIRKPGMFERYEGTNGFFQVGLISSDESIDEVALEDANHPQQPYGDKPQIEMKIVKGHNARIIKPSNIQGEVNPMIAYIIAFDKPRYINQMTFPYLILWADKNHIDGIIDSLMIKKQN